MDNDTVRKKRLEEIEAKRKRLEEMRKTRGAATANVTDPSKIQPALSNQVSEEDINKGSNDVTAKESDKSDAAALVSSILSGISMPSVNGKTESSSSSTKLSSIEKVKSFGTMRVGSAIHVLPSVPVVYDKGCQTEVEEPLTTEYEDHLSVEGTPVVFQTTDHQTPRKSHIRWGAGVTGSGSHSGHTEAPADIMSTKPRQLSEVDRALILSDPIFSNFLQNASLHVERALEFGNRFDIFKNYTTDSNSRLSSKSDAFELTEGYDEESLQGRPIMDIKWSPIVPELFLVAYGSKYSNLNIATSRLTNTTSTSSGGTEEESPGLVCVWSRELHKRPELKFSAVSPVLVAIFHPNESNLVIGGCYNGQIILWDMKSSKSSPVQRSSLTGKGHKHAVYSMAFTGSSLSNELISISIDGQLCYWDVSRLSEPINVVHLSFPGMSRLPAMDFAALQSPVADKTSLSQPLNVSCMGMSNIDGNPFFIIGSGTGQILKANLPYKPLDPHIHQTNAHFGLVTSIHLHPHQNSKYKHLFLTSSLDWTIKLFSFHNLSEPMFEFVSPTCDYVCDVQWSPVHPAVFSTITSTGKLSLWNLSKSTTEPLDTIALINTDEALSTSSYGTRAGGKSGSAVALNKAVWSKDGQYILVGDSSGNLHRVKLHSMYATASQGDENKFELVLLSPHRSVNNSINRGAMNKEVHAAKELASISVENEEL